MTTEKEKALELAIGQIEKRFGKGSIMKLGESAGISPVKVIPSGSLSLDMALGLGGVPKGRITEIFGPEASGKTTLGLHIIAEAQNQPSPIALSCGCFPNFRNQRNDFRQSIRQPIVR